MPCRRVVFLFGKDWNTREPAKEPLVNSQEYFYEQAYQALAQAEAETAETAKN